MKYLSLIFLTALVITGCENKKTQPAVMTDEERTKETLDHHWKTFQDNDLDGTMADYTEESILITPDRIYKGMKEIRENFESAFLVYPKSSTAMQLNKSVVQQDVAYIIWEATGPKIKLTYGTDTFIIRDGKILRQTYAGVSTAL